MADVKIIDIDSEQWNMKDQLARGKIAELEEKTTVKITKKIDEEKIKMNLIEINGEKFIQLHLNGLKWSGVIGETIATFVQDFGLVNVIRCITVIDFEDSSGRYIAGVDIQSDGRIRIHPSTPNQFSGTYKESRLYGDAFIKVAY